MDGFAPFLNGYQDVTNQLADHLRRRAENALARMETEKAAVTSVATCTARRDRLRRWFLSAIGGVPPLPDTVPSSCTGHLVAPGFTVEKLLLETLPGVFASASLYIPADLVERAPGVLFLCGHHRAAKAAPEYQRVCRALVRAGIVVLAMDPVGQGERLQYVDPTTEAEVVRWGTAEHCYVGLQCHVAGFSVARYFLADAMQALTYLRARPEVDDTRVGVTGNSGGGTQAAYLMFLDDRLHCGAPCTFVTSREAYMRTGQAHDAEQNIRGAISAGLDYDDLVAGLAPKPLCLGAVASDFFPVEGTLHAYAQLKRIYALYGLQDQLHVVVAPGQHAFSTPLQRHVVQFFRRYLIGEGADLSPGLTVLAGPEEAPSGNTRGSAASAVIAADTAGDVWPESTLRVTTRGQVILQHPSSRTVFDLNLDAWRLRCSDGAAAPAGAIAQLHRDVVEPRPRPPLWVREVGRIERDGILSVYAYTFSEPDIALPLVRVQSGSAARTGTIAVVAWPEGTVALRTRWTEVTAMLGQADTVLLFDPRGTGAGEQRPINPYPVDAPYGTEFRLNYDAMMLGDSLLAMRTFDGLRALEYAHRIAPHVAIVGEGTAGLCLLAASVLDGTVATGCFRSLPRSFADLVRERLYCADIALEVYGLTGWPEVADMLAMLPAARVTEWCEVRRP